MVKRYENHGDPRLPLGLFVHESDYEALAARLAEAERDAARYRWLKTERGAAAHEWWIGLPDDEQDAFIDERLAVSAEPVQCRCCKGTGTIIGGGTRELGYERIECDACEGTGTTVNSAP